MGFAILSAGQLFHCKPQGESGRRDGVQERSQLEWYFGPGRDPVGMVDVPSRNSRESLLWTDHKPHSLSPCTAQGRRGRELGVKK